MSRYIDADHLIQRAVDVEGDCWGWDCTCQTVQDFVEYVNAEPTADVKPIVYAEFRIVGDTTMHYECSLCGEAMDKWDNYCKHCGARMKNESEEEE